MSLFDYQHPRRNTGSIKWDKESQLLPYWIADMDFPSPACVLDALKERVDHGIFGYSCPPDDMEELIVRYMAEQHNATISPLWLEHIGGCVPALAVAVRTCCGEGDAVMTCGPVYPPIRSVHHDAGCELVEVPHIWEEGRWGFDWATLEAAVTPAVKMFILCNPQNPLGRVFSPEEVLCLAQFCQRHGLILCSDEIHCDLILDESVKHCSAMTLPIEYHKRLIVLTAPSKTYNIAGIGYTFAVIPDEGLLVAFRKVRGHLLPGLNCFSYVAAYAAYSQGEPWRQELLVYLRHNRAILEDFSARNMPQLVLCPSQATYLAWFDCSALGLDDPQVFFRQRAGVLLNSGVPFGAPQCVRFNFGTSTSLMLEGLQKMEKAIKGGYLNPK